MSTDDILKRILGPRQLGGVYRSGYSNVTYVVVGIDDTNKLRPILTVLDADGPTEGQVREHSTSWNPQRDKVISQPDYSYCEDDDEEEFQRSWDAAEFEKFRADPKRQALVDRILRDI